MNLYLLSKTMNPELINLFGFSIRWYSVLILTGVIIGYLLASREAKKFDISNDFIFDLTFWVVIIGIIGARSYYVLFNFAEYKNNLWNVFAVWNGGLAIHGGILFGFITLLVYCKIKKVSVLRTMDIAVPSLILAQAIGRWGNFFNSEAYGINTTLESLKNLHIPNFIIKGMYIDGIYYHPTFLYESIWCLIGFFILILVRKYYKYLKKGQLSCVYLMWYSLGRFFIEELRTDSLMLFRFKVAQIVCASCYLVGFILFIYFCFSTIKKGLYYPKTKKISK